MKKLIALFVLSCYFCGAHASTVTAYPSAASEPIKVDNDALLKFLAMRIKYPETARSKNVQGSSILLFKVAKGKLSDLRIHNELGEGCDLEVVNAVLAYPDFNVQKDGNYALQAEFRMDGDLDSLNESSIPPGYELMRLVIRGYPLVAVGQGNGSKDFKVNWFNVNTDSSVPIIRGKGLNQPQVVIDDVLVEYEGLKFINPNEVESMTVLKATSAILKYGERGAFGAIIIVTRKKSNLTPTKAPDTKNSKEH